MAKKKKKANKKIEKTKSNVVRKYICNECKKRFRRNQFLKLHQLVHSDRVKKIKCPLWPSCAKVRRTNGYYSTKANLEVHLQKHQDFYPMPEKLEVVGFERNECKCAVLNRIQWFVFKFGQCFHFC